MDPNAFALLMLCVIAVSLGFAGYYFQMTLEQAWPIMPAALHDDGRARAPQLFAIAHRRLHRFVGNDRARRRQ